MSAQSSTPRGPKYNTTKQKNVASGKEIAGVKGRPSGPTGVGDGTISPVVKTRSYQAPEIVDGVTVIWSLGDVVLEFQPDERSHDLVSFRVEPKQLNKASPNYFQRLFGDTRFGEAAEYKAHWETLNKTYSNPEDVPSSRVPRMRIIDVGAVHVNKSVRPLLTDFFLILHGLELAAKRVPIGNLANLAVVADRFDCVPTVARWARFGGHLTMPASANTEESLRQRLLVGMLLGHAKMVSTYSKELILTGSMRWADQSHDPPNAAMWWDLPKGVEEELQYRKTCVLETILSLLAHCMRLYTSRERQCRLGYDSSPQCDSFQLGEFTRFLTRTAYLKACTLYLLEPTPDVANEVHPKDINLAISSLRGCPSYQIDTNHAHCGPRKLIISGLDAIQSMLTERGIGICYDCWTSPQPRNPPWLGAERSWFGNLLSFHERITMPRDHTDDPKVQGEHYSAKDFFMAKEKIWDSNEH